MSSSDLLHTPVPTDDNARPCGQRADGMTSALTIINFFLKEEGKRTKEGRKKGDATLQWPLWKVPPVKQKS